MIPCDAGQTLSSSSFSSQRQSGGSWASRIYSDDKMDGSCSETSKSLPDIQIFPFVKNEVLCMLKVWIVLFWERLKPAYISCCETVQLCLMECLLQSLLII